MLTVQDHWLREDGSILLTLRLAGPLPAEPAEMLPTVLRDGATATMAGDDLLLTWQWSELMVPLDAPAACAAAVRADLAPYLPGWVASLGGAAAPVSLTDRGTEL